MNAKVAMIRKKKYFFSINFRMLKTSIDKLLSEFIFSKSLVTKEEIKQKLYELLGPRIDNKEELDALLICLTDIVIRHRTKRLPDFVNMIVSKYLPISDARKYLVGVNLPPNQINIQLKERKLQIQQRYKKLLQQGKYKSWDKLIKGEYEKGRPFDELTPFITAQNIIDSDQRSYLWHYLMIEEYEKGRPFKELIPYMTAQNLSGEEYTHSDLWDKLIRGEYEKGRSFKELITFVTAQNMPSELIRSDFWHHLILNEYETGRMSFEELIPFITSENIPYVFTRDSLWMNLIKKESRKGRPTHELMHFIRLKNMREQ